MPIANDAVRYTHRILPCCAPLNFADSPHTAAQRVADRLRPEWIYLDVPQLLKHLLGLANDPTKPDGLIYLWFDTGQRDADAHRLEIERFTREVAKDVVTFGSATYQDTFRTLTESDEPVAGWYKYIGQRYFTYRAR